MKFIVSSKHLAIQLNQLKDEWVQSVAIDHDKLTLTTKNKSVVINGAGPGTDYYFTECSRWDWVRKLVNQVDEQPIVLNISENNVKVIFEY